MRHRAYGFGLVDLLAVVALIALVGALGVPVLERSRELSRRLVCGVNLKALGGAAEVYADANNGRWMTPPFASRKIDDEGIHYTCLGNDSQDIACVGFERARASISETPLHPAAGSTAVSTTRAYWMLVRSGDVTAEQFVCPSSGNSPDPTTDIDSYYDFPDHANISYGYLVPFGPVETRPRQGRDHRMIFAADKGPFYHQIMIDFETAGPDGREVNLSDPPQYWRRFNSPNHGGIGNGEGQNALFADGRVEFHDIPAFGLDQDNIYTVMRDDWFILPYNRIHGDTPHTSTNPNPYPGQDAFGPGVGRFATTDSLIYP